MQLIGIVEAYISANCADASFRAVICLQSYMAVGRCSEVAINDWHSVAWNHEHHIAVHNWRDIKNSKKKPVPILPSRVKHQLDLYLIYADAGILGNFNLGGPSKGQDHKIIFDQFSFVNKAAPKVSRMIEDITQGSTSGAYCSHLVPSIVPGTTSHGFRHGPIEDMEGTGVEGGLAADLSGHAPPSGGSGPTKTSSAFESSYHVATVARTIMGKEMHVLL